MKSFIKLSVLAILLMCIATTATYAQAKGGKRQTINPDSVLSLKNRWAFRTNAIDWIAMLPNVAVEFDLSKRLFNNWTVAISAKGNWTTPSIFPNNYFYDLTTVRLEFKRYNRTTLSNLDKDWWQRIFTWKKKNPTGDRVWFLGPYVDLSKYNMKFSDTGHRGKAIGAGLTFGFGRSLYKYKHGALDLELSASLGAVYTQFDTYTLSERTNNYEYIDRSVNKILPYPVISDIRLGFVYRFSTVNGKYIERSTIRERYKAIKTKNNNRRDSIRQERRAKEIEDSIAYAAAHPAQPEVEEVQGDSTDTHKTKGGKGIFSKLFGKKKSKRDKTAEDTTTSLVTPDTGDSTPALPAQDTDAATPVETRQADEAADTTLTESGKKDKKKSRKSKKEKKKDSDSQTADAKESVSPDSNDDDTAITNDKKKSKKSRKKKKAETAEAVEVSETNEEGVK